MFMIILTYIKSTEIVEAHVVAHRRHLDEYYSKELLLVSGPQVPRTGGIIVTIMSDRAQLQQFIEHDPFYIHNIAEYQVIEFNAVKYHAALKDTIN